MAAHLELGQKGEKMAVAYLKKAGFTILYRNWKHVPVEIDIIAEKHGKLHIVEVKMRSSAHGGLPEENVTRKKLGFLLQAADEFLFQHQQYKDFQLDILAITTINGQPPEYFFIEDVYL